MNSSVTLGFTSIPHMKRIQRLQLLLIINYFINSLTYYSTPGKSFLVITSYHFSPEFLLEIVISSVVVLVLLHPNWVILVKTVSKVGMWPSKDNQNSSLGFEKKKLELFSSLMSGKYYEDAFFKTVMTYPQLV